MKKISNYLLIILISIISVLIISPTKVLASTEYDLWINAEQFTSDKTSIACGSGTATFDVDTNTLTLVNATIDKYIQDGWDYYSIRSKLPNLTIDLVGNNTIDGKNNADGINAAGGSNVIIKGSGTLTMNNAYYGIYIGYYDTPGGDLKIENTTVTVNESYAAGIWVNHDINFVNSDVTINPTRDERYSGIVSNNDGTITVNGGLIKVDNKKQAILLGNGDSSAHKLIVNSGKLDLTSTGFYGIYFQPVIGPEGEETNAVNGKIEINGGIVDITSNSGGTNIPESDITLSNEMEYCEENTNFSSTGNILIKKSYTLTLDLNGGTPKVGYEDFFSNQIVEDGEKIELSYVKSQIDLHANAPEGKVLDAFEINGTRYELDSTYIIHSDTNVKSLWKNDSSSVQYKVIDGANSSYTEGSNETITVRADGDYSKFIGIKVDGTLVETENYTSKSGSTIVTLKKEYLNTLSVGKHTLTFVYNDGECSTEFEVKVANTNPENPPANTEPEKSVDNSSDKSTNNPKTGDNIIMIISIFAISILGIFITLKINKNRKVRKH